MLSVCESLALVGYEVGFLSFFSQEEKPRDKNLETTARCSRYVCSRSSGCCIPRALFQAESIWHPIRNNPGSSPHLVETVFFFSLWYHIYGCSGGLNLRVGGTAHWRRWCLYGARTRLLRYHVCVCRLLVSLCALFSLVLPTRPCSPFLVPSSLAVVRFGFVSV